MEHQMFEHTTRPTFGVTTTQTSMAFEADSGYTDGPPVIKVEQIFDDEPTGFPDESMPDFDVKVEELKHEELDIEGEIPPIDYDIPGPSDVSEFSATLAEEVQHFCPICQKYYANKNSLHKHKQKVHPEKTPFNCEICNKVFPFSYALVQHLRVHTGEKPHVCSVCQEKFARLDHLKLHHIKHSGEKLHYCTTCNKSYATAYKLKTHTRTHTGEKPFSCEVCNKSFMQGYHLTNHRKIHEGVKEFQCDLCEKLFRKKFHLTEHLKTHTGERPFSCDKCSKRFKQKAHMQKHLKTHDSETD